LLLTWIEERKMLGRLLSLIRRNKLKTLLLFVCASALSFVVLLLLILQPTNARDNDDPVKKQEMLRITLDVGDLAPIPKVAIIKSIKTDGNMFTRSFNIEFSADVKVIKKWLDDSKGIKSAKVVKLSKSTQYIINAKCGWQYAEVILNQNKDTQNTKTENTKEIKKSNTQKKKKKLEQNH
jgi:hypothetical protein